MLGESPFLLSINVSMAGVLCTMVSGKIKENLLKGSQTVTSGWSCNSTNITYLNNYKNGSCGHSYIPSLAVRQTK